MPVDAMLKANAGKASAFAVPAGRARKLPENRRRGIPVLFDAAGAHARQKLLVWWEKPLYRAG